MRVALVLGAIVALSLGCASWRRSLSKSSVSASAGTPAPARGTGDDPPPLHTGGLGVLSSGPGGVQQGIGANPAGHGSPVAEAVATGVGATILGAKAAETVVDCTRPGARVECLQGPGPTFESDAGAR